MRPHSRRSTMKDTFIETIVDKFFPQLNSISLIYSDQELEEDMHYGRPGRKKTTRENTPSLP